MTEPAVPYALFRSNYGHTVVLPTRAHYEHARAVARVCRCGQCDCCRAVEYVTETNPEVA